eukprot:scaffold78944_cov33-Phaeocystis_antarctica.AAC.1
MQMRRRRVRRRRRAWRLCRSAQRRRAGVALRPHGYRATRRPARREGEAVRVHREGVGFVRGCAGLCGA